MKTVWRLLALCVVGLCSGVQAQGLPSAEVTARALSADQQAEAVRRALLTESLKKPLRVVANAWIDEQGRLHENAQFTTDMKVRGVRVASYVQQGDSAEAELELRTERDTSAADCGLVRPIWRRPAHVVVSATDGFAQGEHALVHTVLSELATVLRTSDRIQQAWLPRALGWQPATRYQAFLMGPGTPYESWQVELVLSPLPASVAPPPTPRSVRDALTRLGAVSAQEPWSVRLELRWVDRQHPDRSLAWREDVRVQPDTTVDHSGRALVLVRERLHSALSRGLHQMERSLSCDPMVVAVSSGEGGFTLPLGADSGVKTGDRVVMMDRSQLPQRVLEPTALNGLGIAEVRQVDGRSARLQWVGGPPPQMARDWVALPIASASRL